MVNGINDEGNLSAKLGEEYPAAFGGASFVNLHVFTPALVVSCQTVRKEGSRGGRAEFKWEDVKDSHHRENYLGHSLMAPVGRWQKGRDLNWYAKGEDGGQSEADARKEELRRVKQAEEEAMAKALGLDPPQSSVNMIELGPRQGEDKNTNPTRTGASEVPTRTLQDTNDDLRRERRRDREGHDRRRRSTSRDRGSRRHRDYDGHRNTADRDRHRHKRHRSRSPPRDAQGLRSRSGRHERDKSDRKRDYDSKRHQRSNSPHERRPRH